MGLVVTMSRITTLQRFVLYLCVVLSNKRDHVTSLLIITEWYIGQGRNWKENSNYAFLCTYGIAMYKEFPIDAKPPHCKLPLQCIYMYHATYTTAAQ